MATLTIHVNDIEAIEIKILDLNKNPVTDKYGRPLSNSFKFNEDRTVPDRDYIIQLIPISGYQINRVFTRDKYGRETDKPFEDKLLYEEQINLNINDFGNPSKYEVNIEIGEFINEGGGDGSDSIPFNNVYLVDNRKLRSLMKEGLTFSWGDPNNPKTQDLSNFILGVLELPFPIEKNLVGDETPIIIADRKLKTTAKTIYTDEYTINIGSITIPAKYNNSYDYMNTTIRLHLPYMSVIELEAEYVIENTVSINYVINLYDGETTVNIHSDKVNKIIYSENINIGRNIPFINNRTRKIGDLTNFGGTKNGVNTAFIEVIRNIPIEVNLFNNEITKQSKLTEVKGFVTIDNIILNSSASLEEQIRIKNELGNGVYIK